MGRAECQGGAGAAEDVVRTLLGLIVQNYCEDVWLAMLGFIVQNCQQQGGMRMYICRQGGDPNVLLDWAGAGRSSHVFLLERDVVDLEGPSGFRFLRNVNWSRFVGFCGFRVAVSSGSGGDLEIVRVRRSGKSGNNNKAQKQHVLDQLILVSPAHDRRLSKS